MELTRPEQMASDHGNKLPIFWGHGKQDPLVHFPWAEKSVEFLKTKLGVKEATSDDPVGIDFHAYNGLVHSANDREMDDLRVLLEKVVPARKE